MNAILTDFDIETLVRISGELQAMACKHNADSELVDLITATSRTLNPLFEYNDRDKCICRSYHERTGLHIGDCPLSIIQS